jgi:hypothetical protein
MSTWVPIRYRGFYDVPRNFIVNHGGAQYLFSCPFDDELDEYPAVFKVFLLPYLAEPDLECDWEELPSKATQYLGEVAVESIRFDSSRRKEMETSVLEDLVRVVHSKRA